jgi:hypothetical protein
MEQERKGKTWSWDIIEAIELIISSQGHKKMRIWSNLKSFELSVTHLENFEQFGQILMQQAFAREIPFHIRKE